MLGACTKTSMLPPTFINTDLSDKVNLKFYQGNLESYFVLEREVNKYFLKIFFTLPKNDPLQLTIKSEMKVLINNHFIISLYPIHNPQIVEYDINSPIATALYSLTYAVGDKEMDIISKATEMQVQIKGKSQLFFAAAKGIKNLDKFIQRSYPY